MYDRTVLIPGIVSFQPSTPRSSSNLLLSVTRSYRYYIYTYHFLSLPPLIFVFFLEQTKIRIPFFSPEEDSQLSIRRKHAFHHRLVFFFFGARKMGTAGWLPATPGPSPVLYSRSPTYPCKRPRIPASLDARFQCDRPRYFCVDSAARLKVDSRLWGIGIIRGTRPTRFAKLCQRPTYVYIYISEAQVRAPFFLPFLVSPQCFPPSRISGRPLLARVSSNAISLQIEPFIRARIESIEVCCSIEI